MIFFHASKEWYSPFFFFLLTECTLLSAALQPSPTADEKSSLKQHISKSWWTLESYLLPHLVSWLVVGVAGFKMKRKHLDSPASSVMLSIKLYPTIPKFPLQWCGIELSLSIVVSGYLLLKKRWCTVLVLIIRSRHISSSSGGVDQRKSANI